LIGINRLQLDNFPRQLQALGPARIFGGAIQFRDHKNKDRIVIGLQELCIVTDWQL